MRWNPAIFPHFSSLHHKLLHLGVPKIWMKKTGNVDSILKANLSTSSLATRKALVFLNVNYVRLTTDANVFLGITLILKKGYLFVIGIPRIALKKLWRIQIQVMIVIVLLIVLQLGTQYGHSQSEKK